jgi:hypothetical protein
MTADKPSKPHSDRKAAYAAWRERMKDKKVIDLTEEDEVAAPSNDWSTDSLFVSSDEADEIAQQ